jgi:hypothetical protein
MLLLCVACRQQYDHKGRTPLVGVGDRYLYREELMAVLPAELSSADSILFAEHYLHHWVEDVLLYQKAKNNIPDSKEIERLTDNYRKTLIVHAYQQELISQKLSGEIPEEELQRYYRQNGHLFTLEHPLLKGLFIKVPLNAPQLNNVRRWYKSYTRDAVENLEKYSLQSAVTYNYFYDKWVSLTEILDLMPLKVPDEETYIQSNRHIELRDTAFLYFLNVSDFLRTGEAKPYEFARSEVKDMLLNLKQVNYMEQVKADLYNQAIKENKITYYIDIQNEKVYEP